MLNQAGLVKRPRVPISQARQAFNETFGTTPMLFPRGIVMTVGKDAQGGVDINVIFQTQEIPYKTY